MAKSSRAASLRRSRATRRLSRSISAPMRPKCRPMLRVANVSAGYGGFQALFDVTLDGPSAGLAPVVVQSMFELVRRICAQGYTVLIVEQNIRQVLKVVSRAYLLDAGRIVQSGTAAELLAAPQIQKAYLGI